MKIKITKINSYIRKYIKTIKIKNYIDFVKKYMKFIGKYTIYIFKLVKWSLKHKIFPVITKKLPFLMPLVSKIKTYFKKIVLIIRKLIKKIIIKIKEFKKENPKEFLAASIFLIILIINIPILILYLINSRTTNRYVIYADPKTYINVLGKELPIDTSITKASGSYQFKNTKNTFQSYYKNNPTTKKAIKFTNGQSAINFYTPKEQTFGNLVSSNPTTLSNTITYPSIFTNIDLRYTISSTRLLEEFIIDNRETASQISQIRQEAITDNVTNYTEKNGSIIFQKNDKSTFTIPKPVMYELNNPTVKSYAIYYEITPLSANNYTIKKIITDEGKTWLLDPVRTYPIVIDLVIDNADIASNWVSSDITNTVVSQETTIKQEGTGSVKVQTLAPSTSLDLMEYSSDANAQAAYAKMASPTGGNITYDGNYTIHTFTSNGNFIISEGDVNIEYLVLAGGGGGGNNAGSAGGAGGYRSSVVGESSGGGAAAESIINVSANTYPVVIGAGGIGGSIPNGNRGDGGYGGNSSWNSIVSIGGGGGCAGGSGPTSSNGRAGGSGGGAADYKTRASGTGGAGTPGQGYKGGDASTTATTFTSGGGGGAGAVGQNSTGGYAANGTGVTSSINGTPTLRAVGGSGNTVNLGGGGASYGDGGTGVVILRYLTTPLQSYSEGTIKEEGSYALKGVAAITDSLNKTLTRTISPTIDLSGQELIKFDIRSSRTGSNIKIGIHDSGGTTTEITPNITSANTFQEIQWDISGVTNANKDVIDRIIITIVNADAANTFYIDDMTTTYGSFGDTITLTKSPTDLSNSVNIIYWVRSSVAGSFARIQFGESASDEQTNNFTINSADTWEKKTWDISGIPETDRDAVTKFAFKIISDSQGATIYFDNIVGNEPSNTPTLSTTYLHDKTKTPDTAPEIRFSTTDPDSDDLEYQFTWDTDSSFPSSTSKTSNTDAGFLDITDGGDTDPFGSGDTISYTFQSALSDNTTYFYKVRAKDPSGSNVYSSYSSVKSFTIDTSLNQNGWGETHADQFSTDTLTDSYVSDDNNNIYVIAASQVIDDADTVANWSSSDEFNTNISQETTIKNEGTGSVKIKTSGFTGDGADGAITVSSSKNINTNNIISGRTCIDGGDAVNYSVTDLSANTATLTTSPDSSSGCLVAGDEVLLINLQGTASGFGNVGKYEILEIQNVNGDIVTFKTNKANYYGSGTSDDNNIGTTDSDQKVMLQRVPNYTNVTVNSSQSFYPSAWNGVKGGIIAFKASGTVTIDGTITVSGMGYRLGAYNGSTIGGDAGEGSIVHLSTPGRGGSTSSAGYDGLWSGGGGGGANSGGGYVGGAGTTNLGSSGGGGGGSSLRRNTTYNGNGGGGGGGGNGAGGYGATGYYYAAEDGTSTTSGAGHAGGVPHDSEGGGGGGGKATSDASDRSLLTFGGGGGGGARGQGSSGTYYNGNAGANGAGIVFISADSIDINGAVTATGNNSGAAQTCGGTGGGGAGGTVLLIGDTVDIGTSKVNASGGIASDVGRGYGGDGGVGRVMVDYVSSGSGTSTPAALLSDSPLSLNDTIEKTTSAIDLSVYETIKFWVRSQRTGQNMRFQFGETVSSEQIYDITINSANTWEQKIFDISSIASGDRDAVTKFAFEVTNTDTADFFYFDYIENIDLGGGSGNIISTAITAANIDSSDSTWGTLIWNDTETNGDIKYSIYYDNTGTPTIIPDGVLTGNSDGFDDHPINLVNISTTTYPILYLKANLSYFGGSPTLDDWTILFNNIPEIPSLDQPNNSATGIPIRSVILKTTTTDNNNDYLVYKITVCTNSDMTLNCQTFDQTSSQTGWSGQDANGGLAYDSGTQSTYTIQSLLSPNTVYYWKSSAKDPEGTNIWGFTQETPYSFKTSKAPEIPSLDLPTDTAINQSVYPLLKTTTTDSDNDYVQYKILLCTNTDMTLNCQTFDQTSSQTGWSGQDANGGLAYDSGTQATYTVHSILDFDTIFYWKSYAIDPDGSESWSLTQITPFSFTTGNEPTQPTELQTEGLSNPTGVTDTTPEFSAISHHSVEGATFTKYQIKVDDDVNFASPIWDSGDSGTAMTSCTDGNRSSDISYAGSALSTNGSKYYWKIRFWDEWDIISPWSTEQALFVMDQENASNMPSSCRIKEEIYESSLTLLWDDKSSSENQYRIERNVNGAGFSFLVNKAANSTSHNDSTISTNHTYQYRVRAEGSSNSEWCTTTTVDLSLGNFYFKGVNLK